MTPDELESLKKRAFANDKLDHQAFDELVRRYREEAHEKDFEQAIELWMAGWTSEPLRHGLEVMSWYWRRPPIGKRSRGKLFYSTNQAFMSLRRSQGRPPYNP